MMIESLNEKITRISSGPYRTAPMNTRNAPRTIAPAISRRRADTGTRRSATRSTSTASAVTSARSRDPAGRPLAHPGLDLRPGLQPLVVVGRDLRRDRRRHHLGVVQAQVLDHLRRQLVDRLLVRDPVVVVLRVVVLRWRREIVVDHRVCGVEVLRALGDRPATGPRQRPVRNRQEIGLLAALGERDRIVVEAPTTSVYIALVERGRIVGEAHATGHHTNRVELQELAVAFIERPELVLVRQEVVADLV